MSQVLFYALTATQYAGLATKNDNALYFLTDANRIYKGASPFTHPVQAVTDFPATGETGTLYIKTGTYEAKIWNGTAMATVSLPVATAIAGDSTDAQLATALAVKNYIDGQIADVSAGVTGAVANVSYNATNKSLSVQKGTGEPVVTALAGLFDDVSYNGSTGVLSFTTNGGTAKTVNLPVENFLAAASFDQATSILTLTLTDGTTATVNLGDLVDVYSGGATSTNAVTVTNGVISAAAKVSAETGNIVEAKADGLYAAVTWQTL